MIKVAELFYSLQGEGLFIGTPSIFLRTFGCNFQCAGFSMPKGELSTERLNINPEMYTKYEHLPLVHTGCDSYPSWDVRFKKLSPMMSNDQIIEKIINLLPQNKFDFSKHLIITGGEPLLGWQKQYIELLSRLEKEYGLCELTFETNGTQALNDDLKKFLQNSCIETTFSVSSKLPSSGEKWEDAIKPNVVKTYDGIGNLYFKWVVSHKDDVADVKRAISEYSAAGIKSLVYIMPSGGTTLHYNENEQWVADICMKEGWKYSSRLQVSLWKNEWST